MPGGRWEHVATGERLGRVDSPLERDIAVPGLAWPGGQGLELVVSLAGDIHVRIAIAGDVIAGDAHAPDLHPHPAIRVRVEPRWLVSGDAPQLVLPVEVVMAVVGHSQVASAGPVPVAEQDRQGAVAGRERDRRGIAGALRGRADQGAVGTRARRRSGGIETKVVAHGERGQSCAALPFRAKGGGPGVTGVERQGLVRPLEAAVADTPKEHAFADPQDRQVHLPVAVDVERIGAVDVGEIGGGIVHRGEA